MFKVEYVYRLIDPRNDSIFYVGVTENMTRRFYAHTATASWHLRNSKKNAQIIEIQASGLQPVMESIATVYVDITGIDCSGIYPPRVHVRMIAERVEQQWIDFYREMGITLTNGERRRKRPCYCSRCRAEKVRLSKYQIVS